MFRTLLLIHRYLGIAIGLLIVLWCLSGFVVMYVQFPELTDREYLYSLPELDRSSCCRIDARVLDDDAGIDEVVIESVAGRLVLRLLDTYGQLQNVDLESGQRIDALDERLATVQAESFFRELGITGDTASLGSVERDQWTVAGYFDDLRPFYLFAAGDEEGNRIYVSSVTGIPVQDTTRSERFWNWPGSVVHWIYPTLLRKNTALWSQVIIWATLISIFLVVIGAYLGIRQIGRERNGRLSPYKGWTLWHHYTGLFFGLLSLTWLLSGLFSMNPWDLFVGDDGRAERRDLQAYTITSSDVRSLVDALPQATLPPDTVRIRSAPLSGEFVVATYDSTGNITRLDGRTLAASPLPGETWRKLPSMLRAGDAVLDAGWIEDGDNYYYNHHEKVDFPVFRLILDDAERTRLYFRQETAELVAKVDGDRRSSRWWFLALHRGDVAGLSQSRPWWDLVMLPLLLGVTVSAVTGFYLGIRRLLR